MKKRLVTLILLSMTACASGDEAVTTLAIRLVNEGGAGLPQQYRNDYIKCGTKALSQLPSQKINAALRAPDGPEIWAILGSDALDSYVKICREVDLKRGFPPKK